MYFAFATKIKSASLHHFRENWLIFWEDLGEKLNNQALMYMYSFIVFKYVNLIQQREKNNREKWLIF